MFAHKGTTIHYDAHFVYIPIIAEEFDILGVGPGVALDDVWGVRLEPCVLEDVEP